MKVIPLNDHLLVKRLDAEEKAAQALVLCPTRELARQIHGEFERMNAGRPAEHRLQAVAVYGGTAYGPQISAFKEGAPLVIGTPGRVLDHLQRGALRLDRLRLLILDEADEMLSMGFYPDMRKLQRFLPRERQGAMFSATMVGRAKPFPDLFLHAAASMGVMPADCVVIEDSVAGTQAGIAAGMRVFSYHGDAYADPDGLEMAGGILFDDMRKLAKLIPIH